MGVGLTPIILKETLTLDELRGKRLSVDGNGELYQFLALIRLKDGSPLQDSHGRITSHLSGLFYRTTRLIADFGIESSSSSTASRHRSSPPKSSAAAPSRPATTRSTRTRCAREIWQRRTRRQR